jgi:CheY-like chemotaxis protein
MMRQEKPDLVLLDIMMDHTLDGWCVSEAMYEDHDLMNIPIIIVTGIARTPHGGEFPTDQYLHAREWLDKPVRYDTLLEKIKLHLHGLPQPHNGTPHL